MVEEVGDWQENEMGEGAAERYYDITVINFKVQAMKLGLEPAGHRLQIGSPRTNFCPQTCFFGRKWLACMTFLNQLNQLPTFLKIQEISH